VERRSDIPTIATDPVDYQALRTAYKQWREFLDVGQAAAAKCFQRFYLDEVKAPFESHSTLKISLFDEAMFPSLFTELPIHPRAGLPGISSADLPHEWNLSSISPLIAENPLARFLLAFIWKQGDFDKLKYLLAGFHGRSGNGAVVLRQFGRHLACPLEEPIFDQHTSRHVMLYDRLGAQTSFQAYRDFFGRKHGLIPMTQVPLTKAKRLEEFLLWWKSKLGDTPHGRLPTNPGERGEAILWADRIMFTLGKAASLVPPASGDKS
jgi:hypothetical protein